MTRTWRRATRVAVALAAVVSSSALPAPPTAEAAPPEQRVLLISDSVGLGSKGALGRAFPADWDVNVVGTPAYMVDQLRDRYVLPLRGTSLMGDHVVMAGGYNYPFWDPDRFDREIDSTVAALTAAGVDHVYWVTLREVKPEYISPGAWRQIQPYYWYFPTVNEHFERAVERHANLTLVDWAAEADRTGITYDAIHLNPTGAALYSGLVRAAVDNNATAVADGGVTRVRVSDSPGTAAVAVNLTATGTRATGFFSAYPCDSPQPEVSNLNHRRAHTVAASAIVPVGPSGEICVYNHTSSQVIVDLFGRFDGGAGIAAGAPVRVLDTRQRPEGRQLAGQELRVNVGDGSGGAVALNVTGLEADGVGFVTVHECGGPSDLTSNVNVEPGAVTPNVVVARPDARGDVCITTSTTAHLLVDRFAAFTGSAPLEVNEPRRLVDTRSDGSTRAAGRVVRFAVADAGIDTSTAVAGVFMNVAVVEADEEGFATAYPCADGLPATSNVNYEAGQIVANFATVRPDADGEICVFSLAAADILVDVMGAARTGFSGIVPQRILDTRQSTS